MQQQSRVACQNGAGPGQKKQYDYTMIYLRVWGGHWTVRVRLMWRIENWEFTKGLVRHESRQTWMARKVASCPPPKACTPPPAFSSGRLSAQETWDTYTVHAQMRMGKGKRNIPLPGPGRVCMGQLGASWAYVAAWIKNVWGSGLRVPLISASERISIIKTTHRIGPDEKRCVCSFVGVAQREVYDALLRQRERLRTSKIAVHNYIQLIISDKILFASP